MCNVILWYFCDVAICIMVVSPSSKVIRAISPDHKLSGAMLSTGADGRGRPSEPASRPNTCVVSICVRFTPPVVPRSHLAWVYIPAVPDYADMYSKPQNYMLKLGIVSCH